MVREPDHIHVAKLEHHMGTDEVSLDLRFDKGTLDFLLVETFSLGQYTREPFSSVTYKLHQYMTTHPGDRARIAAAIAVKLGG
jgi:hypothetical protein